MALDDLSRPFEPESLRDGPMVERRAGKAQTCNPTGILCGQWWPGGVGGVALEPLQSPLVPLIPGSSWQSKPPPTAAVPDVKQQQLQAVTSVLMLGGQSW